MISDHITTTSEDGTKPAGTTDSIVGAEPLSIIDAFVGDWWVLHTRARNEKVVASHLRRRDIQFFLPLVRRRRTYGKAVRFGDIPLFPGYVFLCGTSEDRCEALKTNRVANVINVGDPEGLKRDLRRIEQVVNSDEPVDLYPRLKSGARCLIRSGSLAGLEGVVLRRQGPWKIYIGVAFIGQSAELEIDPSLLEVID